MLVLPELGRLITPPELRGEALLLKPEASCTKLTYLADMDTTPFFIRFNSVSESFDSTQLMAHNGFTIIDSNQFTTVDLEY